MFGIPDGPVGPVPIAQVARLDQAAAKAPAAARAAGDVFAASAGPARAADAGMTPAQKQRAELLTSLFENSSLELQYGYAENLHDGRGVTAGRAGFCSGTSDMREVVRRYARLAPHSPLARFLPRLAAIDALKEGRDATQGLEGLEQAWAQAAADPRFRAVQDAVVDETYFRPAMTHADRLGLKSAIARGQLYDALIQHGDGDDPDGVPAMIKRANQRAGGSPAQGVDEVRWLKAFLQVRRDTLAHASDPSTRQAWAESVSRVDAYSQVLASGNLDLHGPIPVTVYGADFTVP
jgi:chitosanase